MSEINVILAVDKLFGIGLNGKLPWNIKDELNIFKEKTSNSIVIMGRKTIEHLPKLKNRIIFGISNEYIELMNDHFKNDKDIRFFSNFEEAFEEAKTLNKKIFVAGGSKLYNYIFENYKNQIKLHISFINEEYYCDAYFNKNNLEDFYIDKEIIFENFKHYEMKYIKHGEWQYINLIKDLLKNGERRVGRNAETISDFCKHLKFDLREGFPLLTTKKMFLKGIIEELLFFIRGETNSKILEEKGINIWKGNTNREFLDANGFKDRKEGEMGPMYGFQWRFFNSEYSLGGVDQIKNIINEIKTNPASRRILLTTYNPSQVNLGVLYPCHSIIIQFYVQNTFLDMFCYNRSSDAGLGLPFNIASSSLLLMIIAKLTNLTPRYFNISLGDVHIYSNHIEPIKQQIERISYSFPTIKLPEFSILEEVEKLTYKDFSLENYNSHTSIKMEMIA
jgi:thymidylate synthase